MAVEVIPLNILAAPGGGGAAPVVNVVDSFNRLTLNPAGVPPLWASQVMGILPYSSPNAIGGYTAQGQNDAQNGLNATLVGQSNPLTVFPAVLECIGLTIPLVWGKTQHCQCKWIGAGAVVSAGPAVMLDATPSPVSNGSCYCILIVGGPATRLCKFTGGSNLWTENDLIAPIPGDVPSSGDVYRLSVQVGVSSNILTVKKNGTQIATFTDSVSPLTTGIPGFTIGSGAITAGVSPTQQFRSVDCGLGL